MLLVESFEVKWMDPICAASKASSSSTIQKFNYFSQTTHLDSFECELRTFTWQTVIAKIISSDLEV